MAFPEYCRIEVSRDLKTKGVRLLPLQHLPENLEDLINL